jgi:hypothetical protein
LFKFGGNLTQGQFVLLKDKQPDPALPVRGGFEDRTGHVGDAGPDMEERKKMLEAVKTAKSESAVGLLNPNLAGYEAAMNVAPIYPGLYRMKLSLWGFHWNGGKPEPGTDQAAVLRAHEEGKQQEGGRLLRAFTAPSMASVTTAASARDTSAIFSPVAGLRTVTVSPPGCHWPSIHASGSNQKSGSVFMFMDHNYSHETAPNLAASSQKTARIVSLHSTRRVFRR